MTTNFYTDLTPLIPNNHVRLCLLTSAEGVKRKFKKPSSNLLLLFFMLF